MVLFSGCPSLHRPVMFCLACKVFTPARRTMNQVREGLAPGAKPFCGREILLKIKGLSAGRATKYIVSSTAADDSHQNRERG